MTKLFQAPCLHTSVVSSTSFEDMTEPPSSLTVKSWWGNAIFFAMASRLQNLLLMGRKPSKGWRTFCAFYGRQHEWKAGVVWGDGQKVCQSLPRACLVDSSGQAVGRQQWWPVLWVWNPYGPGVVCWCQAQAIQLSCPWETHASRIVNLRTATFEVLDHLGVTRSAVATPFPMPCGSRQSEAAFRSTVKIEEVFDDVQESCHDDLSNDDESTRVESSVMVGDVEEF
jgi:hypothetical protein